MCSSSTAPCCGAMPPVLLFYLLNLSFSITGASSFAIPSQPQPQPQKTTSHEPAPITATAPFELPSISDLCDEQNSRSPLSGSRGEVVGATGRIGSLLLRSGCGTLAATPRGVSPGSFSEPGTPIFVAVHAAAVPNIVRSTLPRRRRDLVFVTNGLPSRILASLDGGTNTYNESAQEDIDNLLEHVTLSVPHFGVLSVGGDVVTSSLSPPTFVHGRHSAYLSSLLQPHGIVVEQVDSISDLEAAAVKKLMWSSAMWLLCHEREDRHEKEGHDYESCSDGDVGIRPKPITVAMVHEKKEAKLRAIVTELLPAANNLVGGGCKLGSADEILAYFRLYSLSMPDAIPSKDLALNELPERNGLFLYFNTSSPITPIHKSLLEKVGGPGACALAMSRECSSAEENTDGDFQRILSHSACPSLAFVTQNAVDVSTAEQRVRDVIVVGGGFIGSSVALALARRGVCVTVLDRRDINNGDIGEATKASWAWLNANDKTPWSYFSLNHLGMKVWRNDPVLSGLPTWCGGLVRRKKRINTSIEDDPAKGGAYAGIGPLARDEVIALDPTAEFLGEPPSCGEEIYFYPDEGHLDPARAIYAIRQEASRLGATFVGGIAVERTIVGGDGKVCGVVAGDGKQWAADAVLVAAGIGSKHLSGLDIIRQPGMIALTKPATGSTKESTSGVSTTCCRREEAEENWGTSPRRILVDTINEAHILQRKKGELAVGGGYLQVGGVAGALHLDSGGVNKIDEEDVKLAAAREMIKSASKVSPSAIERVELSHAESADRPMPSDGLPAIGFCQPGLFLVCSHSGITLGPLLGELAAIEICGVTPEDLIGDFRPTRFENGCVDNEVV